MLKVEELSKSFRTEEIETIALNKVSFRSHRRRIHCGHGAGCGKSTLLNILGLLDNPTSGKLPARKGSRNPEGKKDRTLYRKGKIGFVFQSFNLIDELNVYENVELPLIYLRVKAAQRKKWSTRSSTG